MTEMYAIDCTRSQVARIRSFVPRIGIDETFVQEIEAARLWKTRAGAERWLAVRNITDWRIVPVAMRKGTRGGLVPRLALLAA